LAKITDEGFVYVDVRTPEEVAAGHPEGAFNIPVKLRTAAGMTPNPDFVRVVSAHFPKDAKLVLGCQSGNRSMAAAQLLIDAGFTHLLEQRAGFGGIRDAFGGVAEHGWQGAGLPVSTTLDPGHSYPELLATLDSENG
jgi:rhodanese-related sulfurtransferase